MHEIESNQGGISEQEPRIKVDVQVLDNRNLVTATGNQPFEVVASSDGLESYLNNRVRQDTVRLEGEFKLPIYFGKRGVEELALERLGDTTISETQMKELRKLSGTIYYGTFFSMKGDEFVLINSSLLLDYPPGEIKAANITKEQLEENGRDRLARALTHELEHVLQYLDTIRKLQMDRDNLEENAWILVGESVGGGFGIVGGAATSLGLMKAFEAELKNRDTEAGLRKSEAPRKLSRREFLKGAAAITTGAVLGFQNARWWGKKAGLLHRKHANTSEAEARKVSQEFMGSNVSKVRDAIRVKFERI